MGNGKNIRIMAGCNLLANQEAISYVNHCQMWYNLGKRHPDIEFLSHMPRRLPIDTMRNHTAKYALANECDYIFFYDDDVIVPLDAIEKLLKCDADVAAGLTFVRGTPFDPMIYQIKMVNGDFNLPSMVDYKDHVDENGIVECYAVGFSCVLIKVETLKKIPAPYFMTGQLNTEDIYYCCKLKDHIPDARIVVDTTIKTKHLLDREYVDADNVEILREFYTQKDDKTGDRSLETAQEAVRRIA